MVRTQALQCGGRGVRVVGRQRSQGRLGRGDAGLDPSVHDDIVGSIDRRSSWEQRP